jgi:hypothetical protein
MTKIASGKTTVVDFDTIRQWSPSLRKALSHHVSDEVITEIARRRPEFVTDARKLLFELAGRDGVINASLEWIRSSAVVAYHGTRLTDDDIEKIRKQGLIPLVAAARRARLERALSSHQNWPAARRRISDVLTDLGPRNRAGHREGQVHLTLSRAGLANSFNHYLTHGAEFDQHAATELLGEDGRDLLAKDGKKILIHVVVAGEDALSACHPYFTVEDMRGRGEVPNLIGDMLNVWSYRLAHPRFDPKMLEVDCGLVFREALPADRIKMIETLPD